MSYINDKVIIITGAAGGFGRLIATKAAGLGARVVAADIDEAELANTVSAIESEGGRAIAVKADVTNPADMSALIDAAVKAFERVDVLINNAGTMPLAYYADHEKATAAWSLCIDINIKGVLNGITAAYDQMIKQGRGHIVNMSSIYGNYPVKGAAVYGATKAAVNFLSEALRQETQGRIKVTNIKPTAVPSTGIAGSVINPDAVAGIMGANQAASMERYGAIMDGTSPPQWSDADNIEFFSMSPEILVDQVLYAINQPWGVSIGDLTIRASGDMYVI